MTIAATMTLLNALAAFLLTLQGAHATPATTQSAVNVAENGIQLAAQAVAASQMPFAMAKNNGIWPNAADLDNAAYRNASGGWVHVNAGVTLLEQYTSFGDLNHDDLDDAAVIVAKPSASGTAGGTGNQSYFLDAMLNQAGNMFDIAELPLGSTININSHHVTSGTIIIDNKQYKLFGTSLYVEGF